LEELRQTLGHYFLYIKALHVMSVAVWSFSTAVAWVWYLKPALTAARARPDDPLRRARRDEFMDRFDRGAALEHYAFAILVSTAIAMLWINGVDLTRWSFVTVKFWIGVFVILPMEAIDIYLSHLGGNKARVRAAHGQLNHERMMEWHWIFFRVTEPLVVVLIPTMFFLAILKPF